MKENIVWYQINPLYFRQIAEEYQLIGKEENLNLFDLVRKALPTLKQKGFTGLWLMPFYLTGQINKRGQGHLCSISEYELDLQFGNDNDLINLIQAAQEMGFKIIAEFIANHLASDASFLQNKTKDLIYLDPENKPFFDQNWTDTIKLNHSAPEVIGFVSATLQCLLKYYKFDGLRLTLANYVFHGADKPIKSGMGDFQFWSKALSNTAFDGKIWLAEVEEEKNHDFNGYKDHFELIKDGMTAQENQIPNLFFKQFSFQLIGKVFQERFFNELFYQAQIAHLAGIDIKQGFYPFLHYATNHNHCPSLSLYSSPEAYILSSEIMAFLPGDFSVYAGEEFGLRIKPSLMGINYCDEAGNMLESKQIKFSDQNTKNLINESLNFALNLRSSEQTLQKGNLLIAQVLNEHNSLSRSLVGFVRYLPEKEDLILIVANLSNKEARGEIKSFFRTFDFPAYEFKLAELLAWIKPNKTGSKLKLEALKPVLVDYILEQQNKAFHFTLKPLSSQFFKFKFM